MENFHSSGVFTKQAHKEIPEGLFEEEHGRSGFFGRVSHIYHENPLTSWSNISGNLKPRCMPNSFSNTEGFYTNILYNDDVTLSLGHFLKTEREYIRNADFDELFFIHEGLGTVETLYGPLDFKTGDYIVIPRGTTYKFFYEEKTQIFRVESKSEFEQPSRGILGPNALYDQTAITIPKSQKGSETLDEYNIKIKHCGEWTTLTYPFNPLDAQGWKGSLYPWKISIYDYCPIMSHRYHIPPSGHTTFVCKNFVVCSFVARPLEDSSEKVLKVPFYHSNIDYDEVLFYHKGNFFSRDNIDPGALTFHPQGIHHGPHPKAIKNSEKKTHTDEFAVMVDTRHPLKRSSHFKNWENQDYWKSWIS